MKKQKIILFGIVLLLILLTKYVFISDEKDIVTENDCEFTEAQLISFMDDNGLRVVVKEDVVKSEEFRKGSELFSLFDRKSNQENSASFTLSDDELNSLIDRELLNTIIKDTTMRAFYCDINSPCSIDGEIYTFKENEYADLFFRFLKNLSLGAKFSAVFPCKVLGFKYDNSVFLVYDYCTNPSFDVEDFGRYADCSCSNNTVFERYNF